MPSVDPELEMPRHAPGDPAEDSQPEEVQFPPVSRDHILNCSYDKWFPEYVSMAANVSVYAIKC